jgi:hypothetical protein
VTEVDPTLLPLDELRAMRAELLSEEDAVSYVRRLVQARVDLIDAEIRRRGATDPNEGGNDLRSVLGAHLTTGSARPPRPAVDASEHPLAIELDRLCSSLGVSDLASLSDEQLADVRSQLRDFEQSRSAERQALFNRIDALSAELVRRYREGEAAIEGLLADE